MNLVLEGRVDCRNTRFIVKRKINSYMPNTKWVLDSRYIPELIWYLLTFVITGEEGNSF